MSYYEQLKLSLEQTSVNQTYYSITNWYLPLIYIKLVNFLYFYCLWWFNDSTIIGWIYFKVCFHLLLWSFSMSTGSFMMFIYSYFPSFYFILFMYQRYLFIQFKSLWLSWLFMLSHFILLFYHHCTWQSRWDHQVQWFCLRLLFYWHIFIPVLWLCSFDIAIDCKCTVLMTYIVGLLTFLPWVI